MQRYPKAIGPYSAYREANSFIFISGQIPIDPQNGEVVNGDIAQQSTQVLKNLQAILEENGLGFENVVKTTVFLADINEFTPMNEIYAKFFKAPYPARSAIAVKDLPKGVKVEIEAIAFKK
ncbi:RidA family protein [Campylobacter sp. US33a]|uniref:RidA family protein n=1 Tax=Campylobacter sp. CCS1377 TaxID=3158229 RepID=A0AAU7E6E3_9BACT|nr:RidA family protein [Campylobacter sp. US33a]MCW1359699.1 RidA family protein [Campylobacter jejuni]TEY04521.1 RidA family protein [Campylobacter sp. US33a]